MPPRIGILTSDDVRHRYFVNAIAARFNVTAVAYQDTGYVPADTAAEHIDARTAGIIKHHFDERRRQELAYLGHNAQPLTTTAGCVVRAVDAKTLNSPETANMLEAQRVDFVLVYGTGLIKQPLIDRFHDRMINMHLGLSPYYRGNAANFYPLVNEEPEFVGATIHMIDPGIDTGPILHHARPDITAADMPHTVGCKTILAGIEKVLQTVDEFARGRLDPIPQWPVDNPKLYLRKDYHPSQVVRLYELIDAGLFPRYTERAHRVRDAFRLAP